MHDSNLIVGILGDTNHFNLRDLIKAADQLTLILLSHAHSLYAISKVIGCVNSSYSY